MSTSSNQIYSNRFTGEAYKSSAEQKNENDIKTLQDNYENITHTSDFSNGTDTLSNVSFELSRYRDICVITGLNVILTTTTVGADNFTASTSLPVNYRPTGLAEIKMSWGASDGGTDIAATLEVTIAGVLILRKYDGSNFATAASTGINRFSNSFLIVT